MNKIFKTSIALACLASSANAISNTKEEIVVTAKNNQTLENVLQTVYVFDLAEIEAAQARDIPALIDEVAGISFRDSGGRGSATSVFVRGGSSSQTIVLIDGVRVGSATLGAAALNSYPIEAIERIEIIKGPFSGIYGGDAAAGVIQLFTKKGGEGLGSVRSTIGSDSLQEFGVAFNGGNEKNSFHVAINSEDTDGIDRTSIVTGGNDDEDGFEETAISFGGQVALSDSVTGKLNILATDSEVEFDNNFGTDPGLVTESDTFSAALNITAKLSDSITWTTTLGLNEDQSVTNGNFPSDLTTERSTFGSDFVFTLSDSTVLTTGLDYYEEDIVSPTTTFDISNRDNKGVFAQLTNQSGVFGFAASARYDDNSAYGTESNGSVAVSVDLSNDIKATASYGTAFSAPSFNFLYFPNFGNPDILPEEADSFEVKLEGSNDVLSWAVAAYKTDFTNLFSFDPNTFLAANVGEAEIEGIEGSLRTTIAHWDLSINADILSAKNVETGVELDDRAEQTLALKAAKDFGAFDLLFNLKSESNRFDRSGTELSSYALLDVAANYDINQKIRVSANVDNLFDKDYTVNLVSSTERFNTAGRQARISVKVSF